MKKPKIISVINQKGGVGKTTTAVNVASYLSKDGYKVLIIDADPQANATSGVGINKDGIRTSLYDFLVGDAKLADVVFSTDTDNLDILVANSALASLDHDLSGRDQREFVMKSKLASSDFNKYDYILIDCPPSLGLLTINNLTASDYILIPVQAEYYALEGLSQLLQVVMAVSKEYNPELEIIGVVVTMHDKRTVLSSQVYKELASYFKAKMFKSIIPRNIKLAEAPSFGKPISEHDRWSKGARAYKSLTKELINRIGDGV
ncbi:hypothetical protein A3F37_03375 [Candidatus Saccharibacteria bacterium RIFCSPHIGHO2_12_FULL_41_12]|nr:MAG: hypothetical protein A3F37_03375 [Candidatus Saccharibacteria bacterium RIFCSPHIGHO2_12_FULL_41_12]